MKKLKVIIDIRIIIKALSENEKWTGILYAAYNIIKNLVNNNAIKPIFFIDSITKEQYKQVKKLLNINVLKIFKVCSQENIIYRITKIKHSCIKHPNNFFMKKYLWLINSIILPTRIKINSFCYKKTISSYDIFFSPIYKVPDYLDNNNQIRKFVLLYDAVPLIMPEKNPTSNPDSWFMQLVRQINSNDNYFTISEFTKNEFIRLVPRIDGDKTTATLLAADGSFKPDRDEGKNKSIREKYGIPQDKRYYLSLCTIEPRKNLVFAVRNFISFIKKNDITDLVFVLAGGHWDQFSAAISKEISVFDSRRNIIIQTGYVEAEDLAPLYSNAECFVYVSTYEGFGLPPLEAMQCGTPVITSNAASLPEVVGDAGIMVDPYDDSALINSYEKIYSDVELRKKLSKKGIERATQFSWKKCTDTMIDKFSKSKNYNVIQRLTPDIGTQSTKTYKIGIPLSFGQEGGCTGNIYCISGFSCAEAGHTWTDGQVAKMHFLIKEDVKDLILELDYDTFDGKQPVSIYANNCSIVDYIANGTEHRKFVVPSKIVNKSQEFQLVFIFLQAHSPLSVGMGGDVRKLALALKSMRIVEKKD